MTAPITPDERAAMRKRAERLHHYGGESQEASEDILKALDALDIAEAKVDLLKAEIRRDLARLNGPERSTPNPPAPVKPDREAVARFLNPVAWKAYDAMMATYPDEPTNPVIVEDSLTKADAMLTAWTSESRATVQAEALGEVRAWVSDHASESISRRVLKAHLDDRIAALEHHGADGPPTDDHEAPENGAITTTHTPGGTT